MPESPKWLFVNSKYPEVRKIIYGLQAKNGMKSDSRDKFIFKEETEDHKKDVQNKDETKDDEEQA